MDSVEAFRTTFLSAHGLELAIETTAGTTIVADPSRTDSAIASAYVFGAHVVVFCNPIACDRLNSFEAPPFDPDFGTPLTTFAAWGASAGAEFVGSAVMRVLEAVPADRSSDESTTRITRMDREKPDDVARIQDLVDSCSEADVEQSGVEMDNLDPMIGCIEDSPAGPLIAYSSAFSNEDLGGRFDIGVLTHPGHRNAGLGRRTVSWLVEEILRGGQVPIYRHDVDNVGSAAIADSLGFVPATRLTAIRLPASWLGEQSASNQA